MPAKSICGGPITTRLLILCIFIGILCALCASLFCVQRGKKAIRFGKGAKKKSRKIWHSYWSFSEWRSGKHGSEGVKGAVCSSCIWALLSVADLCWLRLLLFHQYCSLHFDHLNNFNLSWCTHVSFLVCACVWFISATVVCCIWSVTSLEIDRLNKKWKLHFDWSGVIASSGIEFSSW